MTGFVISFLSRGGVFACISPEVRGRWKMMVGLDELTNETYERTEK
jgi:hypothetical protein